MLQPSLVPYLTLKFSEINHSTQIDFNIWFGKDAASLGKKFSQLYFSKSVD